MPGYSSEHEIMQLRMPYELVKGVVQENARTTLEELRLQVSLLYDELAAARSGSPANAAAAATGALSGNAEAAVRAADEARQAAERKLWELKEQYDKELETRQLELGTDPAPEPSFGFVVALTVTPPDWRRLWRRAQPSTSASCSSRKSCWRKRSPSRST